MNFDSIGNYWTTWCISVDVCNGENASMAGVQGEEEHAGIAYSTHKTLI